MRVALTVLAIATVAFAAGYWLGGTTTPSSALQDQLAQITKDLQEIKTARPAVAAAPRRTGPDPAKVYEVKVDGAPLRGAENARVTIVEFSDFQCPFCSRVTPTLEQLLEDYPDDVRVVYKHLPLPFHQRALPAAKAAVAAGKQGKFWEMHDLLFANQQNLDDETLRAHAAQLGLDAEQFQADSGSAEVAAIVAEDLKQAGELGVTGTPGFFVNGRFLSGAQPYQAFTSRVEQELSQES